MPQPASLSFLIAMRCSCTIALIGDPHSVLIISRLKELTSSQRIILLNGSAGSKLFLRQGGEVACSHLCPLVLSVPGALMRASLGRAASSCPEAENVRSFKLDSRAIHTLQQA